MTPQEREARAELTILTTFNLKRAENALSLAESKIALGRDGYTMARAWAEQAGIYTLDMRAPSLASQLPAWHALPSSRRSWPLVPSRRPQRPTSGWRDGTQPLAASEVSAKR